MLISDLAHLEELSKISGIAGGELQYQVFYSPSFNLEELQKIFTTSPGVAVSFVLDPTIGNGIVIKGTGVGVSQSYAVSGTLTGSNQSLSFQVSSSVSVS